MAEPSLSEQPDWQALAALVDPSRPTPFLVAVQQHLQFGQLHYRAMHEGLGSIFSSGPCGAERSLTFLLACLEELLLQQPPAGTGGGPAGVLLDPPAGGELAHAEALAAADAPGLAEAGVAVEAAAAVGNEAEQPETEPGTAPVRKQKPQQRQQQSDSWRGTVAHLLLELVPPQQGQQLVQVSQQLEPQQQEQQRQGEAEEQQQQEQRMQQAQAATSLQPQPLPAGLLLAQRPRVVALFSACVGQPRHARVALKVAQAFGLDSNDVPDLPSLAAAVSELLANRTTLTPGLGLVMHFQVVYVECCISADRLKAAARATRVFGLKQEFPDVESRYRRSAVVKLASKRVWAVAATFAGADPMVAADEAGLAEEYRRRFELPPDVLKLDPEEVAAQEAARAARFLPFALPPERLLWVDGPAGLAAAAAALSGADILGIDVDGSEREDSEEHSGSGDSEESEEWGEGESEEEGDAESEGEGNDESEGEA
ncbi:hypothetical protein TSOC_007411 [Tetrabaena socialis]|uniref:Uncharacterized protein n=1 Tax=Tetrabaena socialis TaxID=47790 RepID=A0A2J8A121_9CHLO|nr:hypothetical protein TSOC_007411 [Tetrabaena socialis]|eukprot:PNH06222.1 hypothetical protein TSOC_007411 [Tetrabaena socialis]